MALEIAPFFVYLQILRVNLYLLTNQKYMLTFTSEFKNYL